MLAALGGLIELACSEPRSNGEPNSRECVRRKTLHSCSLTMWTCFRLVEAQALIGITAQSRDVGKPNLARGALLDG